VSGLAASGALFALPARVALALTAGLGLGAGVALATGATGATPAGASGTHAKTITVSTATIPHIGTVLTTASGLTLYRFSADPAGKATCTGVCAKIWPPLLAARGSHIKGPKGVKGLSLIKVGSGHWQVAFHKDALYRFEGDKKKGQAKGQKVEGKWFAVLKSGVPATPAHATSTSVPAAPTTQPMTSTTQGSNGSTPTSPPASQTPATQPTSPPPTNPPVTSPPPTTTPTTSPPPTTTPTTTGGSGGVSF
jgi:predicted lipoprotein with Yx(FWY)xxD motif